MGGPQFGAALCGCGLLRAAGCGGARRIAATSEVGDGTAGLCAVLSAAMKYSAVAFFFLHIGSFGSGRFRSWFEDLLIDAVLE